MTQIVWNKYDPDFPYMEWDKRQMLERARIWWGVAVKHGRQNHPEMVAAKRIIDALGDETTQ